MSKRNQINIEKISIFAEGRPQLDLISNQGAMFSSCSIYESIFKQYVSGNINIVDSVGMLENYPIVGDEYIIISFKSSIDRSVKPYTKVFKIFKVDNVQDISVKKMQLYTIHFATEIMDDSQKRNLRISFKNQREDQIIKSICQDNLRINIANLDIEPSLYERTFVIPGWSPLKAIQHFTNTAVYPQNSRASNFVFYEDRDGFKFKSLETMMNSESAGTLTTKSMASSEDFEPMNVIEFDIENYFDNIKNSQNGLYGSTVREVDLIEKTVNTYTYTNSSMLEPQLKIDEDAFPIRTKIGEDDTNRKIINSTNNGNYSNGFNSIPKRLFSLQQFENYKINAKIIGNTNFVVGKKVEFDLKSIQRKNTEEKHKYLSGHYLLTDLWHNFTATEHHMMATLRKPSFKNEIKAGGI